MDSTELEILIHPRINSGHCNFKIFIDLSMLQVVTRNHNLSLNRILHISHIFTFIMIPKRWIGFCHIWHNCLQNATSYWISMFCCTLQEKQIIQLRQVCYSWSIIKGRVCLKKEKSFPLWKGLIKHCCKSHSFIAPNLVRYIRFLHVWSIFLTTDKQISGTHTLRLLGFKHVPQSLTEC